VKPYSTRRAAQESSEEVEADVFLDEGRAAEVLSVNSRTLAQWRLRGTGPKFVRISSRCIRYRYRDLMTWADRLLRSSTSEY
jgi:hypothetical protein